MDFALAHPSRVKVLVSMIPSVRKVFLADAAHLPNLDHPDRFQQAVRSFLDELVP